MVKLSERRPFPYTSFFLFAILFIGLIARLWGINFGLPYLYHPDEPHFVCIPFYFIETGDLNPHYFHKSALLMYVLYIIYSTLFVFRPEWKLLGCYEPIFFLTGRIFCAFLGTLTIYLLYILGKTAFSKKTGLISAFFLCLTFLHVCDSHYIAVDVPMTFFIVLSFIFIYKGYLDGNNKNFIYAGIFAGLAASTKYPAAVLAVAVFFANFFYVINNKRKKREMLFGKRLILSAVSMIFAFLAASPFIAFDFLSFKWDFLWQVKHMREGHFGFGLEEPGHWTYHLIRTLPQGMGLTLFLFSLAAIVYILYRHRQKGIFLLIFPVSFYLLISSFRTLFPRYAIPLLPFLNLFAGYLFIEIMNRLNFKRKIWKKITALTFIIVLIGKPAIRIFYQDWLFTRDDTRTQCKRWVEENIPAYTRIGVTLYAPALADMENGPLPHEEEFKKVPGWLAQKQQIRKKLKMDVLKKSKRKYYVSSIRGVIRKIARKDIGSLNKKSKCPDYVILSGEIINRLYRFPRIHAEEIASYELLIKNSQLLRAFSPYRDPGEDRWYIPDKSIFSLIYPGPLIKVYKLNKDSLIADLKHTGREETGAARDYRK